jgi:hypothetical protein
LGLQFGSGSSLLNLAILYSTLELLKSGGRQRQLLLLPGGFGLALGKLFLEFNAGLIHLLA